MHNQLRTDAHIRKHTHKGREKERKENIKKRAEDREAEHRANLKQKALSEAKGKDYEL